MEAPFFVFSKAGFFCKFFLILACNLNFQVNTTLGVKRILEMPATLTFFYLTDFFWRVLSNTMGFLERDFSFFSSRLTLMARLHARRWYVANFLPRCHKFNSIQFSWNGRWHFLWSQNDSPYAIEFWNQSHFINDDYSVFSINSIFVTDKKNFHCKKCLIFVWISFQQKWF